MLANGDPALMRETFECRLRGPPAIMLGGIG
jgi:hypothetical protein